VNLGNESVGFGDHHRARLEFFAGRFVVPLVPQAGDGDRLPVPAPEIIRLLAVRRVLPFVVAGDWDEAAAGLKPGDRWCLCAPRWQQVFEANQALYCC